MISGGRVAGVWKVKGGSVDVALFEDVPRAALATAVARMEALLAAVGSPPEPAVGSTTSS